MEMLQLKNITKIKAPQIGLIVEWKRQRKESVNWKRGEKLLSLNSTEKID